MTNERSSLLAIALCVAFYFGYSQYLSKKYPGYGEPTPAGESASPTAEQPPVNGTTAATAGEQTLQAASVQRLSDQDLTVETDVSVYRFSQELGGPASVRLKKFNDRPGHDGAPVEVLDHPLTVAALSSDLVTKRVKTLAPLSASREGRTLKFSRQEGPWKLDHEYTFPESGYTSEVTATYTNIGQTALDLTAVFAFDEAVKFAHNTSSFSLIPGSPADRPRLVAHAAGSDEFIDAQSFCEDVENVGVATKSDKVEFVGFDSHYFLAVFAPKSSKVNLETIHAGPVQNEVCPVRILVSQPSGIVAPGQSVTVKFDAYFGPKAVEPMAAFNQRLEATLNLGWLDWLAHPLLLGIKGFEKMTGNFGIAIIIVTFLLKILFYPLTRSAAVSMQKMKKLNPEMTRIREKFKDDPRAQQQELMRFMSQHKVNPAKGCLPILPQIPVFFAFYRVLSASIELRHAPFFGWIQDLAASDPYFITPVLLGIGMFVQQKLTPMTGVDKTQERIMLMMPVIFSVMMLTLPAGLVIYMLTNNIVSIAQQQWLNKRLAAQS